VSDFYSKLTSPIAGDNPFGVDARYDLDFDRLKNEMEKLSGIDLDTVESLATKILTEKSKDVRAMGWLAYVMTRRNDVGWLADVISVLAYYCQDHFDSVFPARENAKVAALRWFSESRYDGLCDKITVAATDVPHLTKLIDALSKIRAALEAQFSDSAPPMSSLYKRANDWMKTAKAAAAAAEAAAKPAAVEAEKEVSDSAGDAGSVQPAPPKPAPSSPVGGSPGVARVDSGKDDVVIKLTGAEYRELSECVKKIKTLLKIQ